MLSLSLDLLTLLIIILELIFSTAYLAWIIPDILRCFQACEKQ